MSDEDRALITRLRGHVAQDGYFALTQAEMAALLALAERGLDERADVVAWLLTQEDAEFAKDPNAEHLGIMESCADSIELGAHVGAAAKERTP